MSLNPHVNASLGGNGWSIPGGFWAVGARPRIGTIARAMRLKPASSNENACTGWIWTL